jgi:hypothetical protein
LASVAAASGFASAAVGSDFVVAVVDALVEDSPFASVTALPSLEVFELCPDEEFSSIPSGAVLFPVLFAVVLNWSVTGDSYLTGTRLEPSKVHKFPRASAPYSSSSSPLAFTAPDTLLTGGKFEEGFEAIALSDVSPASSPLGFPSSLFSAADDLSSDEEDSLDGFSEDWFVEDDPLSDAAPSALLEVSPLVYVLVMTEVEVVFWATSLFFSSPAVLSATGFVSLVTVTTVLVTDVFTRVASGFELFLVSSAPASKC